ncbi:hypothetical protein EON65_02360 [archaeon]|nr:MAG: hypothetical protein EON65_02360 [archaeon]
MLVDDRTAFVRCSELDIQMIYPVIPVYFLPPPPKKLCIDFVPFAATSSALFLVFYIYNHTCNIKTNTTSVLHNLPP